MTETVEYTKARLILFFAKDGLVGSKLLYNVESTREAEKFYKEHGYATKVVFDPTSSSKPFDRRIVFKPSLEPDDNLDDDDMEEEIPF